MDTNQETALEKAFNFTVEDLRYNRRGELAPRQANRLRQRASRTFVSVLGVLAILGVLSILTVASSPGELTLFLICLTVPAFVTLAATIGITEASISPRVVSKRTGQVHLAAVPSGYNPPLTDAQSLRLVGRRMGSTGLYSMVLEDLEFRLSSTEHGALTPAIYTVYFIPTLHKIVAIELVSITDESQPAIEFSSPVTSTVIESDDNDVIRA